MTMYLVNIRQPPDVSLKSLKFEMNEKIFFAILLLQQCNKIFYTAGL